MDLRRDLFPDILPQTFDQGHLSFQLPLGLTRVEAGMRRSAVARPRCPAQTPLPTDLPQLTPEQFHLLLGCGQLSGFSCPLHFQATQRLLQVLGLAGQTSKSLLMSLCQGGQLWRKKTFREGQPEGLVKARQPRALPALPGLMFSSQHSQQAVQRILVWLWGPHTHVVHTH